MARVTLSSKNQIVIPREAREKLGLRPGDRLDVSVETEKIVIEKSDEDLSGSLRGLLRRYYGDVGAYLEDERRSWE